MHDVFTRMMMSCPHFISLPARDNHRIDRVRDRQDSFLRLSETDFAACSPGSIREDGSRNFLKIELGKHSAPETFDEQTVLVVKSIVESRKSSRCLMHDCVSLVAAIGFAKFPSEMG
jgi:hypothetical protein